MYENPVPAVTPKPLMIEAVVTCVDYGDFLAQTLPHNRCLFDKMVVVTAPEDKLTRRVCEYWNVECVQTDVFRTRWNQFCKGAGINEGLAKLNKKGWMVHMDGDIILPPLYRNILQNADLDTEFVYGIDRHMCKSHGDWHEFMETPRLQQENGIFVHLGSFPLGVRVCPQSFGGYLPIGFYQQWHADSGIFTYPEDHTDAGRGDMLFSAQWPRKKRALIPEIVGYHLESEAADMGANWNGRKTKPFTLTHQHHK
jgi:hypothetical protein